MDKKADIMKPEIWCHVSLFENKNVRGWPTHETAHFLRHNLGKQKFNEIYARFEKLVLWPYLEIPKALEGQRKRIERIYVDFVAAYKKCGCPAGADDFGKPLVIAGELRHDRLNGCDYHVPYDSSRHELVVLDSVYTALLRIAQAPFYATKYFTDPSPSRERHREDYENGAIGKLEDRIKNDEPVVKAVFSFMEKTGHTGHVSLERDSNGNLIFSENHPL